MQENARIRESKAEVSATSVVVESNSSNDFQKKYWCHINLKCCYHCSRNLLHIFKKKKNIV